jgi:hypothetical protein
MFSLSAMHRINRDLLFHRIVGEIQFDPQLRTKVTNPLVYELADKVCALLCSASVMVIEADIPGFNARTAGKFDVDEPWPEWADRSDLLREGLIAPAMPEPQDNEPQQ